MNYTVLSNHDLKRLVDDVNALQEIGYLVMGATKYHPDVGWYQTLDKMDYASREVLMQLVATIIRCTSHDELEATLLEALDRIGFQVESKSLEDLTCELEGLGVKPFERKYL